MLQEDELLVDPGAPIIPSQRREILIRHLRRKQILSVSQIADIFGCSHMTVRRDIAVLEQEGRVFSVSGGVRLASLVHGEPSHQSKAIAEPVQKQRIAMCAAQMVRDNMTVYLDAGTTTAYMVPHLSTLQGITIVTNDFNIVMALADATQVNVIHTGGVLDHPNRSSVGNLAADTLRNIATDLAFISSSAWDQQRGITTPSAAKIDVKRAAMESASQSILVCTSSKYGTFSMYRIAGLDRFDSIITDDGLSTDAATGIRKIGVELILA